ncbi:MAG: cytochrome c biogenesis protein CcdA [Candidatus Aminicenantes bacterium]|nr:cytochrome c biogenesis protein CcdA [Candidatus Aminicenantes bacterium]MDH5706913.1 cytochrome c biogenesis protein CcdA [Candidatus Aminicenantes bacterium]
MERIFGDIQQLIQSNPWLAVVAVFFGGLLTASNPCVLAMIPLVVSMVAGYQEVANIKKSLVFSLLFILGLSVTFTILGLISGLAGSMFGNVGSFWKYIVVGVCLVMGLHLLGLFKLNFSLPLSVNIKRGGSFKAFFIGLLFGVVSSPCAVPILAVLLAFVASKGNVFYGAFLLFIYALGHSFLVLIAGTSMGAAKKAIESKGLRKANQALQKVAGVIIILVGVYFVFQLW